MDYRSFSLTGPKGKNQDRALEPTFGPSGWISAIADGVGGVGGGEIAAEAAITAVRSAALGSKFDANDVFTCACKLIEKAATSAVGFEKMATTLSVLQITDTLAHVAHVGDSRIYHVRDKGLLTKTEDQTEVAKLVRDGVLTQSQARRYPRRNVIFSYLSSSYSYELYVSTFEIMKNDILIMLTDGAYNVLNKSDLVEIVTSDETIDFRALAVQTHLERNGIRDDSSMLLIDV